MVGLWPRGHGAANAMKSHVPASIVMRTKTIGRPHGLQRSNVGVVRKRVSPARRVKLHRCRGRRPLRKGIPCQRLCHPTGMWRPMVATIAVLDLPNGRPVGPRRRSRGAATACKLHAPLSIVMRTSIFGPPSGGRRKKVGAAGVPALDAQTKVRRQTAQRHPMGRGVTIACQMRVVGPPCSRLGAARTWAKAATRTDKGSRTRRPSPHRQQQQAPHR
mmetsp:Transcript_41405/g.104009  ORF Transcript_41405/g.104009 Transcript_41405/m.104009 type:complete len:217 (-) Transcript_41405:257-907(-)